MIVLMKMKKITLKHLLKPLLIPNENGLEIPVIALKIIFLDLKICDLVSRLKSPLLLKTGCFPFIIIGTATRDSIIRQDCYYLLLLLFKTTTLLFANTTVPAFTTQD